ncbi:uncharacterized protein LOC128722713 [Anopheles nili]|uniref:uncharacterized protein LOC128722713 n=1 Tax=Anopheles nili TaxID=185578 RepID=UPI00237B7FD1|nr:uncharacterized protein LOC128722713 [Anopheles nili]
MSVTAVWNAIIAGDVAALQKCIRSGTPNTNIGQRLDNHRWNILQHAVITRKLDCVKLVVDHFAPDPTVPCYEGLTPLARACEQSVPLEIVQYLLLLNKRIINTGNNEQITPLHYAVSKNRLDIVKLLVANGANPNAMDYANETPLDTAAYDTGNIAILIYLLFVAKAKWGSVPNRLIIFGGRATYPVKKKIACFKILFNHEYPKHAYRQRYYVNDVLAVALMSNGSSSLIPYFIETELKWEKRVDVRSLYSRLMNRFQLLALSVFSHCGPVASESRPKCTIIYNNHQKVVDCIVTMTGKGVDEIVSHILKEETKQALYFDKQLLLLDLPRELLLYLRLCDEDSFRWAASFI